MNQDYMETKERGYLSIVAWYTDHNNAITLMNLGFIGFWTGLAPLQRQLAYSIWTECEYNKGVLI